MPTIIDGMAGLRHVGLSCILAGIVVLLLAAETRQARKQTLAEVVAAAGLTAPREAAVEQGRPITSYAVLDDRSVYVLAYYWDLPSGILEDLHGFDSADLVEEPAATGVHEHGMALHFEQLQHSYRLVFGELPA